MSAGIHRSALFDHSEDIGVWGGEIDVSQLGRVKVDAALAPAAADSLLLPAIAWGISDTGKPLRAPGATLCPAR